MSNKDLYQKVSQFRSDVDIAHRIVHGGATDIIETEGGPVRSLAKLISDNQLVIDQIPILQQAVALLDAEKQSIANLAQDLTSPDSQTYPSTEAVAGALNSLRSQISNAIDNYHKHPTVTSVMAVSERVVDSVLVGEISTVKWVMEITGQTESGLKRHVMEIMGTHDGDATHVATKVDSTAYAILKIGSFTGLSIDVDVVDIGGSQCMVLLVTSAETVTVKTFREQTF